MTLILGVNSFHADSSACILRDGQLLAAAEEERFNRVKHWAGVPVEAVRYCLQEAGATLGDVSVIAVNSDPYANFTRRVQYTLRNHPGFRLIWDRIRSRKKRLSLPRSLAALLDEQSFSGRLQFVEHHLAHLASAFFVSPFAESAVVSVDGFGDFASTAWGFGKDNTLTIGGKIHYPHSLGIFYETITHFLGFKRYGDEYKVMGLAPYGRPRYMKEMKRLVHLAKDGAFRLDLEFFRHHAGKSLVKWNNCEPVAGDYFNDQFIDLLGPPRIPGESLTERHKDIAHSAQRMYEQAFMHLLRHTFEHCKLNAVVLSGGCAFNSVANGKIRTNTPFIKTFVQAAAGDAGGALGAALYAWHVNLGENRRFRMEHAYWGPEYSDNEIVTALARRNAALSDSGHLHMRLDTNALCQRVAVALAEGQVVGWFQGRMEWGPRALGNRSILADPRRGDMKETLNAKIKRRESFRPFAPAILRERVSEWFETDEDEPFMMKVLPVRKERCHEIPAVTHVDGSARLQTVEKHQNPRFYRLIEAFYAITGVPVLLNTSFNENEPIVRSVDEALDCFFRTKMDLLVLGDHLVIRSRIHAENEISTDQLELENLIDGHA